MERSPGFSLMCGKVDGQAILVTKVFATERTNEKVRVILTMDNQMSLVIRSLAETFWTILTIPDLKIFF